VSRLPNADGAGLVAELAEVIVANKAYLSEIDGLIGDGDHGVNMAKGFSRAAERTAGRDLTLDEGMAELADVLLSFPAILLGLAFAAVIGPGMGAIVVALAVATVPDVARITRGAAVVIMGQDFMEAGRSIGLPDRTLLWRYLALNCMSSVFVFLTLRFGQVILIGAVLSFLGLGARPPAAELGMMASQGRDALFFAPHISTLPSLMIVLVVLCANVLGDALRDTLDPRLRNT